MNNGDFEIRQATAVDVPLILSFIRQLAEYERLSHEAVMTEEILKESLFGPRPSAEVLLGYSSGAPVAFAVFFHNFSTFLGRSGLYLEDLFVIPQMRGRGFGRAMLGLRGLRVNASAAGSNGPSWIGTSPRSIF